MAHAQDAGEISECGAASDGYSTRPKMTNLLEEAIKSVRQLPEADQDEAAEILLSLASKREEPVHLDEETRQAVRGGKAQAGRGEFAPDKEMAAFFIRRGG